MSTRRHASYRSMFPVLKALVLRPLVREKIRTSLTVLGIAVGVAVVVAIQLANQSALRAFRESVDAVAGKANYQIAADAGWLDESLLLRLQPLWSSKVRFAPVIDVEGMIGTGDAARPVRLLAVDLMSDLHFRDYRYARIEVGAGAGAAGAPLDQYLALFGSDSIVLPEPLARERGLAIGSPVELSIGGERRTMKVRGLLEASGPASAFNGSIAICDIATAQRSFAMAGRLTRIDLMIPEERAGAILAGLRLPEGVRIERPSRRNERVDRMLRAFRVNLFALAGVALLVGMFLVYNTVLISILRRRRDVGILKTSGVSPLQILAAFLTEGLLFGLLGAGLGLLLGTALAEAILRAVGRTINTLYVATQPEAIVLTPGVAVAGLAVGLLLSLVSSIQPALEASRIPPLAMIRAGLQQRVAHPRTLAIAAAVCFLAGAASSRLPPIDGIAAGGYLAVLLVVGGFSLLAPILVRSTSRLFAPLFERAFGIVGRLAAVSLPASLRRTAVASAALSLATGMMVAVALMVGSFRETVRIWVDQTVTSDLWLRPSKGLSNAGSALFPARIADEILRIPFVEAIDRARGREALYGDSIIAISSGDFDVAAKHGDLPMVTPRRSAPALLEAVRRDGAVVSESFSLHFQKRVGDFVDLPVPGGRARLPITGIYRDYSNDRGVVVMDRALYVRLFRDDAINTVVVYLRSGTVRDNARRVLEQRLGAKFGAFVVTNSEVRREVMRIFDQTFMITYALLGVAIVVAVLGIVNTLAALILERRRELALLRTGGMSVAEVRTMIVLESTLLGAVSTATGLVMGYVLSWILIFVINRQSFGWTIEFHTPALLIAGSLATTFVASSLAGLVPARLAGRVDIATAIKSE